MVAYRWTENIPISWLLPMGNIFLLETLKLLRVITENVCAAQAQAISIKSMY